MALCALLIVARYLNCFGTDISIILHIIHFLFCDMVCKPVASL